MRSTTENQIEIKRLEGRPRRLKLLLLSDCHTQPVPEILERVHQYQDSIHAILYGGNGLPRFHAEDRTPWSRPILIFHSAKSLALISLQSMSGSSSETDASLEDLPELKADLEEARQLISQLEDRKEETDPDRYEHVRQRYEQQIEELEPTVQKLTDQGESRKQDLEDRLATQQEQVEEAEAELREIDQLHEEGAMDEQAYQEDRRRLQQQKNEAEKKASRLERELDEVNFYLTETGNVSYKKKQSMDSGPTFREKLPVWLGLQGGMKKVTYFASAAVIAIAMASTVYLIREGKQNEYKMTQKTALIKCTEKASQKFVKALREKQKGNSELSGLLLARMAKKGEAVFVDEGTKITKKGNWKSLIKVDHQNESYCTTKSFIKPID